MNWRENPLMRADRRPIIEFSIRAHDIYAYVLTGTFQRPKARKNF